MCADSPLWGEKSLCRTVESNQPLHCTWLFDRPLYQLSPSLLPLLWRRRRRQGLIVNPTSCICVYIVSVGTADNPSARKDNPCTLHGTVCALHESTVLVLCIVLFVHCTRGQSLYFAWSCVLVFLCSCVLVFLCSDWFVIVVVVHGLYRGSITDRVFMQGSQVPLVWCCCRWCKLWPCVS